MKYLVWLAVLYVLAHALGVMVHVLKSMDEVVACGRVMFRDFGEEDLGGKVLVILSLILFLCLAPYVLLSQLKDERKLKTQQP